MSLQELLKSVETLSTEELRTLNSVAVEHLKARRNAQAAVKRHTLKVGDTVTWTGKVRHSRVRCKKSGVVQKINRKTAIVKEDRMGEDWKVPLTLLEKKDGLMGVFARHEQEIDAS